MSASGSDIENYSASLGSNPRSFADELSSRCDEADNKCSKGVDSR